jgi:hypothetical protein
MTPIPSLPLAANPSANSEIKNLKSEIKNLKSEFAFLPALK